MPKKPERSEVEFLRSENRRLKSENRHLKKELNRKDKKVKVYEEHIDLTEREDMDTIEPQDQTNRCLQKDCDGQVERVDLGVRMMHVCQSCGGRKTFKK